MRGNNILGILFANVHDEKVHELTEVRTLASAPFGGRYRLIDFPLSNMVNSGINKVGVITNNNYQSLLDHLGSGKAWDLSRKREGLYILPPFGTENSRYVNRVEALSAISNFVVNSREEYVLLSDCDIVCNIDYGDVLSQHIKNNADITAVYKSGKLPTHDSDTVTLSTSPEGRVVELLVNPTQEGECNYGMNMYLLHRDLLLRLVHECVSRNAYDVNRDIMQRNLNNLRIFGYEFTGYSANICSINSFYEANMALMLPKVRDQLFNPMRPIYTKVRDDMPTRYGLGSIVKNSLVADGSLIEGEVENCIIFRGVKVAKGAKLQNCIIMQDTVIGENCCLSYVVTDKDVQIQNDRTLMGFQSYPVFIAKGSVV